MPTVEHYYKRPDGVTELVEVEEWPDDPEVVAKDEARQLIKDAASGARTRVSVKELANAMAKVLGLA